MVTGRWKVIVPHISDQYLHFRSHHPINHKTGVMRTLMDRKDTLESTENDKDKEELHIRTALQKCGYPKWIFEKVKQDQRNKELKAKKRNKKSTSDQSDGGLVVIPYVAGYRKDLSKIRNKHSRKTLQDVKESSSPSQG